MAIAGGFTRMPALDGGGPGAGGGNAPRTGRYARTDNPRTEVRRCGSCGKDAVIVCHAWTHSFQGTPTGQVTRDCRCQACGANVTLRDPGHIKRLTWVPMIFFFTVVLPVGGLLMVWRWKRAWDNNPLVPGAPMPPVQFWRGPGHRRCGRCGKVARLVDLKRSRVNGIPTGTTCKYVCAGCKNAFTTESAGGHTFSLFYFAMFGLGGGLALVAELRKTPRVPSEIAIGSACTLVGLFLLYISLSRIFAALRNPKLAGQEAVA